MEIMARVACLAIKVSASGIDLYWLLYSLTYSYYTYCQCIYNTKHVSYLIHTRCDYLTAISQWLQTIIMDVIITNHSI